MFEEYLEPRQDTLTLKALFAVKSNFSEYYASEIGFNMNNIELKGYCKPSQTEQYLNPSLTFDIDLTEYFIQKDTTVDELTVDLDYSTEVDFDTTVALDYMLMQEQFEFGLQNKYLEFTPLNLTDDSFTLSGDELEQFIHYSSANKKYYLRAQLEYEWNCLLYMNLVGNTTIDIKASVDLTGYEFDVKYSGFETQRLSSFESDMSYSITQIHAPNYIESNDSIYKMDDDMAPDIGLPGGFLLNAETRQRLMVREQLYYTFNGTKVLLDRTSNDYMLRFTSPTGRLNYPDHPFVKDDQLFIFSSMDYYVNNISLFYWNETSDAYQYIDDMELYESSLFTYEWKSLRELTGLEHGDPLRLMFRLCDIAGSTNEYIYNFTTDFIAPQITTTIGNSETNNYESELIAGPLTKINISVEDDHLNTHYYRIINLITGKESEWVEFIPSNVTYLADLAHESPLPERFTLEIKAVDLARNEAINSTYNKNCTVINLSYETDLSWDDNTLDLSSSQLQERELVFNATNDNFGEIPFLDVAIGGFNYGTATYDQAQGVYRFDLGTENTLNNVFGYSDSLLSNKSYSNVNPLSHVCWETRKDEFFGVTKHVLMNGSISIINPISYNASTALELEHLYDRGFALPNFLQLREAYYYNTSMEDPTKVSLQFGQYFVDDYGRVFFPNGSKIDYLYENRNQIKDGVVHFDYYASEFNNQLRMDNTDGIFVNFSLPSVYHRHTTVQKLTVCFDDVMGNTYSKTYYDLDLRKYFMDDVRGKYEETIFGMGSMMTVPLYINLNELQLSGTADAVLDIRALQSITFTIEDSEIWPGSFVRHYEGYDVLNLPYQRVGISDLKLYNSISDSMYRDEDGYSNATITISTPNYFNKSKK